MYRVEDPVFCPLQVTSICEEVTLSKLGSLIVIELESVHPFVSVTIYEYDPALNELGFAPNQFSVYPGVPPDIDKLAEPSFPPLQLTLVVFTTIEISLGSVIVTESIELQLLVSVTVTVYVPADKFEIILVVSPVLHRY